MFEHDGITYYSESEFKKGIENYQSEHKARLKKYNTIRIWILIVLIISLAGNLHLYINYNNSLDLLYVCNAKEILTEYEKLTDDENTKENIKKERDKIYEIENKAMQNKYVDEVINDVMKRDKDLK